MSFKKYLDEVNEDWMKKWENEKDDNEDRIISQANNEIRQIINKENVMAILEHLSSLKSKLETHEDEDIDTNSLFRVKEVISYINKIKDNLSLLQLMVSKGIN
jgi:acyl-CoA hydrolase